MQRMMGRCDAAKKAAPKKPCKFISAVKGCDLIDQLVYLTGRPAVAIHVCWPRNSDDSTWKDFSKKLRWAIPDEAHDDMLFEEECVFFFNTEKERDKFFHKIGTFVYAVSYNALGEPVDENS